MHTNGGSSKNSSSQKRRLAPSLFIGVSFVVAGALLILGSPYLFASNEWVQRFIAGPGGVYRWFWLVLWAGVMFLVGDFLEKRGFARVYKD